MRSGRVKVLTHRRKRKQMVLSFIYKGCHLYTKVIGIYFFQGKYFLEREKKKKEVFFKGQSAESLILPSGPWASCGFHLE